MLIWNHDHDAAYNRQLPLRHLQHAYIVITSHDPVRDSYMAAARCTLWFHWFRLGFANALVFIARCLLAVLALHYVDDYGASERHTTAQSAFDAFERLNSALGFHMKATEAQPPLPSQKVLGPHMASGSGPTRTVYSACLRPLP
eukprot:6351827-Amphidinium_carterae.1